MQVQMDTHGLSKVHTTQQIPIRFTQNFLDKKTNIPTRKFADPLVPKNMNRNYQV